MIPDVSQNIIRWTYGYMDSSNFLKVLWHWFIISVFCWTLSFTWGVFYTCGVTRGVDSPFLRCLIVIEMTGFGCSFLFEQWSFWWEMNDA
jgi:hypothetical protein